MIKKLVTGYIAVAITILLGLNIYNTITEHKLPSDEEMMNMYIEHVCGEDYTGALIDKCDDEFVHFAIYRPDGRCMFKDWCFTRDDFWSYMEID